MATHSPKNWPMLTRPPRTDKRFLSRDRPPPGALAKDCQILYMIGYVLLDVCRFRYLRRANARGRRGGFHLGARFRAACDEGRSSARRLCFALRDIRH